MATHGQPKKVLLADDDADVLALLSATLSGSPNLKVFMARNGAEALEMARREHPDLVFLDVRMPKMDGYSVCHALKSDPATASIPVVMLTAQAQDSDRRKAIEAKADDYLTKPFSPNMLLRKVESVLGMTI